MHFALTIVQLVEAMDFFLYCTATQVQTGTIFYCIFDVLSMHLSALFMT